MIFVGLKLEFFGREIFWDIEFHGVAGLYEDVKTGLYCGFFNFFRKNGTGDGSDDFFGRFLLFTAVLFEFFNTLEVFINIVQYWLRFYFHNGDCCTVFK